MNIISQKYYKEKNRQLGPSPVNYNNVWGKCVYLIGIGGDGMSAIAKTLIDEGCFVSGSDLQRTLNTHNLEEMGAKINTNQDGGRIRPYINLVIISAAISEDNPDLKKARMLGLKVIKDSEFLGSLMESRRGIAVSGTHVKTTISA